MKKINYFIKYPVNTTRLDKTEILVLDKLVEASEYLAEVYRMQVDDSGLPKFFPKDASRSEIEKAAVSYPQILSPYTMVERNEDGKLVTVPYHIKFKEYLKKVAKKLEEAAHISNNKEFAKALRIQAASLLNGNYDKAQIAWLKVRPYIIQINIGPQEPIEDELFFIKHSYQAFIGIAHVGYTERAKSFRDTSFAAKKRFPDEQKLDYIQKSQIRADNLVLFAGVMAKFQFTATTLPNDIKIVEKYGSETTIFLQNVTSTFSKRHYPLFNKIFAPHFRQAFTKEDLERGYLYIVLMHEIGRILIRYRFAPDRLKDLYPAFGDLTFEAVGVKSCGSLLLKDMISQKEMESILVMFLTRIFDFYSETKDNPWMKSYVLGNAVLLNSLISSGALTITKDGISWPNFTKMFIAMSNLADEMEKILAEGNYAQAERYLKKHSSLSIFSQFKSVFDKVR